MLRIVLTSGDPCGIGPEVICGALASAGQERAPRDGSTFIILGDRSVLAQAAATRRQSLAQWDIHPFQARRPRALRSPSRIRLLDLGHRTAFVPGRSSARAGRAALNYLEAALELLQQGEADALVTAPVTKRWIEPWSPGFQGQTEWLARATRASSVVMLFVAEGLRVALVTRHQALRTVAASLTPATVRQTLVTLVQGLEQSFGIRHPRVAICGINPHAGEGGLFGDEERRVLLPALRALRQRGMKLDGPVAADGLFATDLSAYDAIVCCYHDQGLIPFKLMARDRGCQVSLGLPIVRTSPDHGSALDIAGQGRAHPGSMRSAIAVAVELARRRRPRSDAYPSRVT